MLMQGIAAYFATIGFGFLFKVPRNRLFVVGFVGMAGGIFYKLALAYGCSESFSLFIGAIIVSLLSEILARKLKTPVTVFLACALIPLVPGGGLYYTMIDIVAHNFEMATITFINTIINACAIVIGCTFVSSFVNTIIILNRRSTTNTMR